MTRRSAQLALLALAFASGVSSAATTPKHQEWTPQPVPVPAPAKAPAKAPAAAPATAPAKKPLSARDKAILDFARQQVAQPDKTYLAAEQPSDTTTLDPKYAAAYNDYAIWILQHDRETYNWNHTSSVIIFYMVMFLVLSGVWFSWMQFRIAHHPATAQRTVSTATATPVGTDGAALATTGSTPPAAIVTQQQDSVTEFSASPQGIKVASSAIGVVILVISMCFFYLYLDKVYPVTVMPSAQPGSTQGAAAQASGK